ncbi:hypothetical protein [Sedimenticola selenatireducens]|uniref:hypothetical protein n=1 Tax=Sedimenticola selenatireducens TaxID=191960 RepID=UPI0021B43852|nr:hypothetical protein [Sedimenticola selenatireducens]
MSWPTDDLGTTNTDEGIDNPSIARPMINTLIQRVKSIIAARGVANGVADLDADAKVPNARLRLGSAGGVAGLDGNGKVPIAQLPGGAGNGLDADKLDGQEGAYYAPKASPAFTGTPTAPTQAGSDDSTRIATTAFVKALVAAISTLPPANSVGDNELKKSFQADGSWAIPDGGSTRYTVPSGVYMVVSAVAPILLCLYTSGTWKDSFAYGQGGIIISDGANVAFKTTGWVGAAHVYYKKLA